MLIFRRARGKQTRERNDYNFSYYMIWKIPYSSCLRKRKIYIFKKFYLHLAINHILKQKQLYIILGKAQDL